MTAAYFFFFTLPASTSSLSGFIFKFFNAKSSTYSIAFMSWHDSMYCICWNVFQTEIKLSFGVTLFHPKLNSWHFCITQKVIYSLWIKLLKNFSRFLPCKINKSFNLWSYFSFRKCRSCTINIFMNAPTLYSSIVTRSVAYKWLNILLQMKDCQNKS